MRTPRIIGGKRLSLAAALLAALLGPATTRAGGPANKPCPVEEVYEYDEPTPEPSEEQAAAARLASALVTMVAGPPSNYQKPGPKDKPVAAPKVTVAMVVQAPIRPADFAKPAFDQPTFPSENPNSVPEPASLVTGLVGGGLALTAWARRRRRSA